MHRRPHRRRQGEHGLATSKDAIPARRRLDAAARDDLDERIIACLRSDGRLPTKELAQAVGVNEAIVRARIRKLDKAGDMRIVAMVDLAAMGYQFLSVVGVTVRGRAAAEVAADLGAIPQVMTAIVMLGSADIVIRIIARSLDEISELLTNTLPQVPGVEQLAPSLAIKIMKYESEWVPFA